MKQETQTELESGKKEVQNANEESVLKQSEETKNSLIENLQDVVNKMDERLILEGKKKTTIKDFASLKVLGTGTYGKVMLVRHKQ